MSVASLKPKIAELNKEVVTLTTKFENLINEKKF